MILAAIVSNSAGMLTLVGDPATFLVGSAVGMSFGQYLQQVSLGGLLAVLAIIPLLPLLMSPVWRMQVGSWRRLFQGRPSPGRKMLKVAVH